VTQIKHRGEWMSRQGRGPGRAKWNLWVSTDLKTVLNAGGYDGLMNMSESIVPSFGHSNSLEGRVMLGGRGHRCRHVCRVTDPSPTLPVRHMYMADRSYIAG
jgi:hypothetical protein